MGQSLYVGALVRLKFARPGSYEIGVQRDAVINGWGVRNYLAEGNRIITYDRGMKDPDAVGLVMRKYPNDKLRSHDRHWVVLFGTHMYVVEEAILERANLSRREKPRVECT